MPSINPPSLQSLASGLPSDIGVKLGAALRALDKHSTDVALALNKALVLGDSLRILTPYTSSAPLVVPTNIFAPALNAGWTNLGSTNETAGYSKDAGGVVTVYGMVVSASVGTAFSLPAGFRPAADTHLATWVNTAGTEGGGRLKVTASSGAVAIVTGTPSTWGTIHCTFPCSGLSPYVPSCFPFDVLWPNPGLPTLVLAQCLDANAATPSNTVVGVPDWIVANKGGKTVIRVRNIAGLLPSTSYSVTLVCL